MILIRKNSCEETFVDMPKEEKNKDTLCCFHISGKTGKSTMPTEEPQKKIFNIM
jgi:hypothetical protein